MAKETQQLEKQVATLKAQLAKMVKLLEASKELHIKQGLILAEVDAILEGKASLGERMNQIAQMFAEAWGVRYAGGDDHAYLWTHSKERPLLKTLAQSGIDLEDMRGRIDRYLRDEYHAKHRHGFAIFKANVNRYIAPADAAEDFELAGPADCRHVPKCKDDAAHTRRKNQELRASA